MRKAVFMDFYGTVVYENEPHSEEVIRRIFRAGRAESPEEIVSYWWKEYGSFLQKCVGDKYRRQYDLALECLQRCLDKFEADLDAGELRDMMVEHWCCPPMYEDAEQFLKTISDPVYFVTNSDDLFMREAVRNLQLTPAGIITSEEARFAKPHEELYRYALEKSGLTPKDVVHIGDSLKGDVMCPMSLGIQAIWLNRRRQPVPKGVTAAADLRQAAELLAAIK